ncbi:MAG TPA: hypothetical protein VH682_21135, partial [Gemmataceae bacterium]
MLVNFLRRLMNRSRHNPAAVSRALRKRRSALSLHLEVLEDRNLLSTFVPLALVGQTAWSQPMDPEANFQGFIHFSTTTSTSQQLLGSDSISSPYGAVSLALRNTTAQVSIGLGDGLGHSMGGVHFNVMSVEAGFMLNANSQVSPSPQASINPKPMDQLEAGGVTASANTAVSIGAASASQSFPNNQPAPPLPPPTGTV